MTNRMKPQNMERGLLEEVDSIDQRHITVAEAKAAKEVFLTSTSLPVQGITHWVCLVLADTRFLLGSPADLCYSRP